MGEGGSEMGWIGFMTETIMQEKNPIPLYYFVWNIN
jgi:hypothetical protein